MHQPDPLVAEKLLIELTNKNEVEACRFTVQVAAASEASPEYYPYLDTFASLLTAKSSYPRTRAFILCCCQAKWDTEGKLKELLPRMMQLFNDPKPTVVRQTLNAVKEIVVYRPELKQDIEEGIAAIDVSQYRDSMSPLILKDIASVLELIKEDRD